MTYQKEYVKVAQQVLKRPALNYTELSQELERDGWLSRSLDAAILNEILNARERLEILRASPFFSTVDDGSEDALAAYVGVLLGS